MATRARVVGSVVLALAVVAGCTSSKPAATETVKAADTTPPSGPVLLAQFETGVGAVTRGSTAPRWLEPGAVAAFDGSAVFSIRNDSHDGSRRLARIGTGDGQVMQTWPLPAGVTTINAVAPDGKWIALTDRAPGYASQGRTSTEVVVFDAGTATESYRKSLRGDVQPEAFSVDGTMLFVLSHSVDHYRVQTLLLRTGDRFDTSDRDKRVPPEDLHGQAVHGVLSADHTLLATLYRNPGNDREPAFVHVIDLTHGWSYCADLPPPFGTDPNGSDLIELTPKDTVVVAAQQANRLAEIDIGAVHTPGSTPVPVEYRNGSITPPGAAFTSLPGYEYTIATLAS